MADLTSPDAVLRAIQEFDTLGRDQFLSRYGFSKARNCFLVHNGHAYDSKAIVGAAHGYQHPQLGPMCTAGFSGGDATVRPRLEVLGFIVVVTEPTFGPVRPLKLFHDYSRVRVHAYFRRERRLYGGVCTWGLAGNPALNRNLATSCCLSLSAERKPTRDCCFVALSGHELGYLERILVLEASSRSAESVTPVPDFFGSDIGAPRQRNLIHASDEGLERWGVCGDGKRGDHCERKGALRLDRPRRDPVCPTGGWAILYRRV